MKTKACYCVRADKDCSKCDEISFSKTKEDEEWRIMAKTYSQINFIGEGPLTEEHNDGRRKDYTIGWSKKVHDKIGIPLEVMQGANDRAEKYYAELFSLKAFKITQEKEILRSGSRNIELNQRIEKLKRQSFWQRLKYLFSGKLGYGKKQKTTRSAKDKARLEF